MPSDAVWTSLITAATALGSASLGYAAARVQHRVELHKVELQDTAAVRDAREKAEEGRRTLYLLYLARIDALRPMLVPEQPGRPTHARS
jgi:hypothetical protein